MSAIQKYSEVVKGLEFCDDFGEEPLLLAHITTDRSIIAVVGLLGGFIAMAALGFPGLALVGFAVGNDLRYAGNVAEEEGDETPETDTPIATTEQNGAIDVPAETVGEPIAAAPSMQHITSPVWNPAQDLGENPQSALIVGVPGAGKGVTVSVAVRVLKERNPNLKVFVIDPKASPKERGYWESIADDYRCFSLKNCEDPDEGAAWLLRCMDAFRRLSGPKLCIFDELMTAATELELADSKLKALPKLKKFVVGLVGQGDSEAEWLWAMTQSPQVKDLGMSGGVRANLRVIGLVSPKNMTAVEALVSTQLIPKPDGGMDELRAIMAASPVGRAVFDGKIARWLPMPKLENHSGFDRDNRNLADEKPTGNLEDVFGHEFFEGHPLLQKNESWEASQPIEVEAVEVQQSHPLKDKFDRLEALMDGKDSLPIREIQRAFSCKSDEAQQIAQMFCMSQKSSYRFTQSTKANGTVSKSIERV
jgi:hypothetical protein